MPSTMKLVAQTPYVVTTTELNSLANNGLVLLSTTIDNTVGQTTAPGTDGYPLATIEITALFAAQTANPSGFLIWFLPLTDGTNAEAGSATLRPTRTANANLSVIQLASGFTTTPLKYAWTGKIPQGKFKILVLNDATGVATHTSGLSLTIRPETMQAA